MKLKVDGLDCLTFVKLLFLNSRVILSPMEPCDTCGGKGTIVDLTVESPTDVPCPDCGK